MNERRLKLGLGVLSERRFRSFYLARALSLLGDGVVPVALVFAVLSIEGSATSVGIVLAAQTVPRVALILLGGIAGDRLPRRRLMMVSDLLRFATQGCAAFLLISGHARLWHLAALMFVYGAGTAFFMPASTGLIPQLVERDQLQQANALTNLTASSFSLLGPVLAGVLVATVGPGSAFAIDSGSFLASALFLLRIGPLGAVSVVPGSFLEQLRAGWAEVRSRTWLWVDGLFSALGNALTIAPIFVLGPVIAKQSLGGAGAWAAIVACFGAGAIVGGATALRLRPRRPLLIAWALLSLFCLPPALLAVPAPTAAISATALLAGLSLNFANTLWETAVQQHVPAHALSRVTSFCLFLALILTPLGYATVGPVAETIGQRPTLIGAAVWALAASVIALSVPGVRDLRREDIGITPPPDAIEPVDAALKPPAALRRLRSRGRRR